MKQMTGIKGQLALRARLFSESTIVARLYRKRRERKEMMRWRTSQSASPPHRVKQRAVLSYAYVYNLRAFIETGTYLGEMISSVREDFNSIASIELSRDLQEYNQRKFSAFQNVDIFLGDSSSVLPTLLAQLSEPCLFWLDAHYSAGITAMGDTLTPVLDEVRAILSHPLQEHVVLIDDARCFTGEGGYPRIDALAALLKAIRPDLVMAVKDDIIRIIPPLAGREFAKGADC